MAVSPSHSFLALFAVVVGGAGALRAAYDPPPGYYSTAAGLSGASLKTALHNKIKGHARKSYEAAWTALEDLDQDPANTSNVLLLYNGVSRAKSLRDQGDEDANYWNREHVWPLSLGPDTTGTAAGADLHHLFAADKNVNARRGNLPFDTVAGGTTDPEAPLCRYSASAWEPRNADKGLLARALFYMAVRYEANDDVASVDDLELQESLNVAAPKMARLSTLLAWHRAFPPTEAERKRNDRVYAVYQNNRNPFIDNPLFADQVFSSDTPFAAWRRPVFSAAELTNASVSGDTADPDGDGLPNRLEFALNLNPRSKDSAAATTLALATVGGQQRLRLSHRKRRYATDLVFHYETSGNLATWTAFTPAATATVYVDALTDQVTVETPLGGERKFVRVRVERP